MMSEAVAVVVIVKAVDGRVDDNRGCGNVLGRAFVTITRYRLA